MSRAEYRIVADRSRTTANGHTTVIKEVAPYGKSGGMCTTVYPDRVSAEIAIKRLKNECAEFDRNSADAMNKYPHLYDFFYKHTNLRIQSRIVSDWTDD